MNRIYPKYIKRVLDIIFSLAALIILSPVLLIVAVLVRICLGSPVLFCQERPGQIDPKTGKERIFKLYKFRSMRDAKDKDGNLLPDKERLTKLGKILRATSMDELPEIWNILKGDMSIVGPRPWLVKYLDYYNDYEHQRHIVKPGLTGLAQISGRNAASWKHRFELDVEYVHNISFMSDVKIICKTVWKIISHDGIEFTGKTQSIMEYFASRK